MHINPWVENRAPAAELRRLAEARTRGAPWWRWGPYLSERQWGTVHEDYSPGGSAWDYFPHDHARSRAYRWGEDGLLGISDNHGGLCFGVALWNEADQILKERLFGLTGPEGNHGEDVKECYFYLDSTPTHSYMRALYKYPQQAFPYVNLLAENRKRGKDQAEYELVDRTFSARIATSTSRWSTRKPVRQTLSFTLLPQTVGRIALRCGCCRRCGFATHGPGSATIRTQVAYELPNGRFCARWRLGGCTRNIVSWVTTGSPAPEPRSCFSSTTRPTLRASGVARTVRPNLSQGWHQRGSRRRSGRGCRS